MNQICTSKSWLMIFKHKANRPLNDPARDSTEFKTISYNNSTVTEHCMRDGRWKKKHAEKKHRMVLLVQTSVQARWWGGRMGEALGKTQVSSRAPTVNEHNQANSMVSQTVRKTTYCFSSQAGGVSSSIYPLENSLCQGPVRLWLGHFFPFRMALEISKSSREKL